VVNEHNLDISDLNAFLLKRGMRIANGYGVLKGRTFRIAHMGETNKVQLEKLIEAIEEYFNSKK